MDFDAVACCWETSQGQFHSFYPIKDREREELACRRMNQTFHLLYVATPALHAEASGSDEQE